MNIEQLRLELERLRQENQQLRKALCSLQERTGRHTSVSPPHSQSKTEISNHSGAEAKVSLFRNLFKGRDLLVSGRRFRQGRLGRRHRSLPNNLPRF